MSVMKDITLNNVLAIVRHMETGKVIHEIILNTRDLEEVSAEFIRQRPVAALVSLTYGTPRHRGTHSVHVQMNHELVLSYSNKERPLVSYDARKSIFVVN